MKTNKVLWGRKPGETALDEVVITERADQIEAAKEWAITQGYTQFRIVEFNDGDMPDFVGAINTN